MSCHTTPKSMRYKSSTINNFDKVAYVPVLHLNHWMHIWTFCWFLVIADFCRVCVVCLTCMSCRVVCAVFVVAHCLFVVSIVQSPPVSSFHADITSPHHHSSPCDVDCNVMDDVAMDGERVLRETRLDRQQKTRLREIEDNLARLASTDVAEVLPRPVAYLVNSIVIFSNYAYANSICCRFL